MQVLREKKHRKLLPAFWNESLVEFEVPLMEMAGEGMWCHSEEYRGSAWPDGLSHWQYNIGQMMTLGKPINFYLPWFLFNEG